MDQIHLSPLVDQIQLALGHISNTGRRTNRNKNPSKKFLQQKGMRQS
jgi:hypothetical protein